LEGDSWPRWLHSAARRLSPAADLRRVASCADMTSTPNARNQVEVFGLLKNLGTATGHKLFHVRSSGGGRTWDLSLCACSRRSRAGHRSRRAGVVLERARAFLEARVQIAKAARTRDRDSQENFPERRARRANSRTRLVGARRGHPHEDRYGRQRSSTGHGQCVTRHGSFGGDAQFAIGAHTEHYPAQCGVAERHVQEAISDFTEARGLGGSRFLVPRRPRRGKNRPSSRAAD